VSRSSDRLLLIALLAAITACRSRERIIVLDPGRTYTIDLDVDDGAPIGSEHTGDQLRGTAFEPMEIMPLILKADDYGHPIDPSSGELFAWLKSRGYVASIGIITQHLAESRSSAEAYLELERRGFELWFHGHTHMLQADRGEFLKTSLEDQVHSFTEGLRTGKRILGLDFTAFGAPGNAYDTTTSTAIASFPQIEVWLYGPKESPIFILPRPVELEAKVGLVAEVDGVLAALERAMKLDLPAVTLQIHPRQWKKDDIARAQSVIERFCAASPCRFSTPTAQHRWLLERSKLRFRKIDARRWEIDLSGAKHAQRIEARIPMIAR
jgi:hypothetical protein